MEFSRRIGAQEAWSGVVWRPAAAYLGPPWSRGPPPWLRRGLVARRAQAGPRSSRAFSPFPLERCDLAQRRVRRYFAASVQVLVVWRSLLLAASHL